MPTTLTLQAWGVRGASVTLAAADAAGNTAPNTGEGAVIVARNTGAGGLRVRLGAATSCLYGYEDHYLEETIPNDAARHVIPVGLTAGGDYSDRNRFGDGIALTYPDGVTGLLIAVAQMSAMRGVGASASYVAAGAAPTDLVPVEGTPSLFTAAGADGMRIRGNGQDVTCWIKNQGPAQRTIHFTPASRCSFGFFDPETLTIDPGEEETHLKFLPVKHFGREVVITYDAATGLEFAAVRMGAYR